MSCVHKPLNTCRETNLTVWTFLRFNTSNCYGAKFLAPTRLSTPTLHPQQRHWTLLIWAKPKLTENGKKVDKVSAWTSPALRLLIACSTLEHTYPPKHMEALFMFVFCFHAFTPSRAMQAKNDLYTTYPLNAEFFTLEEDFSWFLSLFPADKVFD